ncbi:MAG: STT3 domain-containing protein, partial [Thermoplasmata archaeon]
MNAILGIVFAPFFGGSQVNAGAFFLNLQAPLWAALTVFPIYLIGREIGDRRTGLIAAIIFPFLPATINESIFGYANYLSFYTFIILIVIYAYLRTLKAVGSRRWVSSYRDRKAIVAGFRGFLRTERTAVKWAVFTGVSFGALALAWQGYTYAVAVIGVFIVLVMIIERIRRVDSFGVWFATVIVGVVGFPLAMPYYYFQGEFAGWFDLPLLLFFGSLLLLVPFLFMRDLPWVISIPTLFGVFAAAAAGLFVVEPGYFTNIVTGQGYFIKTLIYSTVAEAQSPSFDTLVISYGVITFFLAFVGLGLIVWTLVRGRFQRWLLFFLIFAGVSLYLPFSASKFLLLGAPAFAL